jgi:hypothetical protein
LNYNQKGAVSSRDSGILIATIADRMTMGFHRSGGTSRALLLEEHPGRVLVIFDDYTWAFEDEYNKQPMEPSLPTKYQRITHVDSGIATAELQRAIAAKRYSDLTPDEKRFYNRVRKQKSVEKLKATPEGRKQLQAAARAGKAKFCERLRQEGKLTDYHRAIARDNARRRAEKRILAASLQTS